MTRAVDMPKRPRLPRLHQEHDSDAPDSSRVWGVWFIKAMPLPSRVVATSKIGQKAGLWW